MKLILILLIIAPFFLSCSTPQQTEHSETEHHIAASTPGKIRDSIESLRPENAADLSGFYLLPDPINALVARAGIMRKAEHSIDVQYYIYRDDLTGQLLAGEMLYAAERGVKVRILIDDLGSYGIDTALMYLNAHPNIDIRLFNAFSRRHSMASQLVFGVGETSRRMHNKALIVDNQLSIVGGRNIGDEYFGANPNVVFDDLDVILTNPVTNDVSGMFDQYWNSPRAINLTDVLKQSVTEQELRAQYATLHEVYQEHAQHPYVKAITESAIFANAGVDAIPLSWAPAVLKADSAEKVEVSRDRHELMLASQLAPLVDSLNEQLLLISPYFVPGKEGVAFFQMLRDKGVDVTILTNSLESNDVSIVHSGYAKYRRELLEMGVKLYEIDGRSSEPVEKERLPDWFASRSSLHAKFFVFDNTATFIGSFNFDPRSFFENTEIGVTLYSPELAAQLTTEVQRMLDNYTFQVTLDENNDLRWQKGDEVFDTEPGAGWFKRTSNYLMRWLPVESQL
uniref:phospholipase D family protein n=1 Tax=Thaumasiovibrio occultus TaxID=1891184 RepID=UPI000B3517B5|nr:phospholipase D family protein [Thaumasiovibrio occultus]